MRVISLRNFNRFKKGEAYDLDPDLAKQLVEQNMMTQNAKVLSEDWGGFTAVVMASGASLTKADIERVRKWRESDSNRRVVVVNATFTGALWADALVALDKDFWEVYKPEFDGLKITGLSETAEKFNGYSLFGENHSLRRSGNSGYAAIDFAVKMGASKVVMLGFDAQFSVKGKAHWHADHPKPLSNAAAVATWAEQAEQLAAEIPDNIQVLNASRKTAITCFDKVKLEEALKC